MSLVEFAPGRFVDPKKIDAATIIPVAAGCRLYLLVNGNDLYGDFSSTEKAVACLKQLHPDFIPTLGNP